MIQNNPVYNRTIRQTEEKPRGTFDNPHSKDDDSREHKAAVARFDARREKRERQEFDHFADKLAKSDHYFVNWQIPDGRKLFPNDPDMRAVTRYYPLSQVGILLIDVFHDAQSEKKCLEKQKVLRSLGYKIVVVKEDSFNFDYEMHEQLRVK